MDNVADFFGIDFEADYMLFSDEFAKEPAVFVIYTSKKCLDIGESEDLHDTLETHGNTKGWIEEAEGLDIHVAVHPDGDKKSRVEKENYLRLKMNPIFPKGLILT